MYRRVMPGLALCALVPFFCIASSFVFVLGLLEVLGMLEVLHLLEFPYILLETRSARYGHDKSNVTPCLVSFVKVKL